jgi:pSer/pThr/pTyr-binding forkhead associated (FHA) protein
MAKLVLMFGERVLNEILIGGAPVIIGRRPENAIVIDNPAVSGQHARVQREGNRYFVEDLESLNGTFLHDKPIVKEALNDGDVLMIGKHKLVFHTAGDEEITDRIKPAAPEVASSAGPNRTVFLDTRAYKERLARLSAEVVAQKVASGDISVGAAGGDAAPKNASLEVLSGWTDKPQYPLDAKTTIVGKSATAQVRLRGWFKPAAAAAITRVGNRYTVTSLGAKTRVNDQIVAAEHELKHGDVIVVKGVRLRFSLKTRITSF